MMETLSISLLGSLRVMLGERPLTKFRTQKLQALLIYLAVEKAKVHRRDTLMGLLWPELPQKSARDTLRQTLSLLRKTIPTQTDVSDTEVPFLLSNRQTVQISPNYPLSVDVHQFLAVAEAGQQKQDALLLQQALDLVQGEFLTDFYLADSSTFERWAEIHRERLRRLTLETMVSLTAVYLAQHHFTLAERIARRQIEMDDLREDAHRQLMMALAQNGRRHEALAQYDALHKLLWDELGVAPEPETQTLLAQIESGELAASPKAQPTAPVKPPPIADKPVFLEMSAMTPASEHDAFVARTAEMAQLHAHLAQSAAGKMGVVFVTGEAGQGKSALLQAFTKQAIAQHETLLVADGTCSAVTGAGDPYHPLREWMTMLVGDLESKWGLGAISSQWARRLWQVAPTVIDTIMNHGRNLAGTLVPAAPIEKRIGSPLPIQEEAVSQPALFAQVTAVLQTLAQQSPLLLVLDDMQWADRGTIGLLFHLGRQLRQSPILLVCAYRPSDVAAGRSGERHPLAAVVQELGRVYGETAVSLEKADHHAFVEAVIDRQPNLLDVQFRQKLYDQTQGHALFTVELLREMRDRGDLVLDEAIQWMATDSLNWEALPARVEAAVAERINRLPDALREMLKVACVEGETFTAELLAHVLELSARELVHSLSSRLDQQHRLVEVVGIDRLGGQRLSRYRFRHNLIYQYLRSQLDSVETVFLHEAVGDALQALAGDETQVVAAQLATHYEQAGLLDKATRFQQQAGDEARRLSAQEEAQSHYSRALALIDQLPPSGTRTTQRMALQTAVLQPQIHRYGFSAPDVAAILNRVHDASQQPHLSALYGLTMGAIWAGNGRLATKWSQQLTASANDPVSQLAAHAAAGQLALLQDDLHKAEEALRLAGSLGDKVEDHLLITNFWHHIPKLCQMRLALVQDLMGDRDGVRETAVAILAQPHSHPQTQAQLLHDAVWLALRWGETEQVADHVRALNAIAYEHDMRHWQAIGTVLMGWVLIQRGNPEDGTAKIEEGKAECAKLNLRLWFEEAL